MRGKYLVIHTCCAEKQRIVEEPWKAQAIDDNMLELLTEPDKDPAHAYANTLLPNFLEEALAYQFAQTRPT